jgi:hypothetical protein
VGVWLVVPPTDSDLGVGSWEQGGRWTMGGGEYILAVGQEVWVWGLCVGAVCSW